MNPIITEQLKSLHRGLKEGIIVPRIGNRALLLKKIQAALKEEYLFKAFEIYPADFRQESQISHLGISSGNQCEERIRRTQGRS